jgi:hypothetical protein
MEATERKPKINDESYCTNVKNNMSSPKSKRSNYIDSHFTVVTQGSNSFHSPSSQLSSSGFKEGLTM